MIESVIFLVSHPFGKRDYDRYGMEVFKANGFDVHVWDVTPFLFPAVYKAVTLSDPIEWNGYRVFQTEGDFVSAVARLSVSSFVFNTEVYNLNTFPIYSALSRKRIPYGVSVLNPGPVLRGDSPRERLLKLTPKKAVGYVFRQIPPNWCGIRPAALVLAIGSRCSIQRPDVTGETRIVFGHNSDYDIFLRLGRNRMANGGPAVFLDNYLPFHPDNLASGHKSAVTPQRYYLALASFFDRFERESGMEVVVAAHPRSRYEESPGVFGQRLVARGKTAEMVRSASLVMTTFSAGVNFAVLYRKPLVFLTSDELEAGMYGSYIHQCASEFGKRPINIDKPLDLSLTDALRVDEAAYAWYQDAYIKTDGSEQLPNWQILCNRIKEL